MIATRLYECRTRGQQDTEQEFSIRYSVLLELLYFDAVRVRVTDPMHLLLGTSKHIMDIL